MQIHTNMDVISKKICLRRSYTDVLKIISAFCVVIGHYASFTLINNWSDSPILHIIASQAGYIGVALFFFLSGYGLMESEQKEHLDFLHFAKRRFLKIYKPVVLITIIWVVFELLFLQKELSWDLIYTVLWGFDDCVLWFVKILMGLYLLFYVFSFYKNKDKSHIGYGVLVIGSVILMIIAKRTDGFSPIGIPCFMLGVIASVTKDIKIETVLLGSLFFVSAAYSAITHDNQGYHAAFDYGLIWILLMVPLIMRSKFSQEYKGASKWLAYTSALTFDIYLIHYKVLDGMTIMGGGKKIYLIVYLAVVLVISFLYNKLRTIIKV